MPYDPDLKAHLEWLGYLQPVGLVVSPHALLQAQAVLNRNILTEHRQFLEHVRAVRPSPDSDPVPIIENFPSFTQGVLGWEAADLLGAPGANPLPVDLEVALPDYEEVLRPTFAVREFEAQASPVGAGFKPAQRGGNAAVDGSEPPGGSETGGSETLPYSYLMLIQILPPGTDLDSHDDEAEAHRWHASPQAKFERLLREKQVPIGLLGNGTHLRLVYAPRGETSGHLTFPVKAMAEVAGRPIFAALHLLLNGERLFSLPARQRLPALLADSRKYQNIVSTKLAGQVLSALYELLRGFQAADDLRHGEVLREVLATDPNQVYAGLLTVLLRGVFVLYAEDRSLLPSDPLYRDHYSVSGLFETLRADADHHPDTMDQRYGAWARLLTLFRLLHDGASHGSLRIPARHGHLFDPERYPFLEGRRAGQPLAPGHTLPLVSDGVVHRVLQNLLVLDGDRLSYRSLDVEQIGSVYEAMMGFRLEVTSGRAIAVKSKKTHGAPTALDLDALLAVSPSQRVKFLTDQTEQTLAGQALKVLQEAQTPEEVVQALGRKVALEATPNIVPAGAMILQPSEERRRSGSHYTPRSLTEPIVRTTLRPILERLGPSPTPEQILSLKVCDMAMGSGAFLVEADRQLGDALVKAWYAHKCLPKVPPDEDEVLYSRRLVAQRCLYGVDKNPLAVDLAKLSLWLATLARDHAFTFLDHSLRCGDSLVGLTKKQITAFHWDPAAQRTFAESLVEERVKKVAELRSAIQLAEDEAQNAELTALLAEADKAIADVRLIGDLAISAFFAGKNDKERRAKREEHLARLTEYLDTRDPAHLVILKDLRSEALEGSRPIPPFHWEIEFPEVFGRENPGFDAIVGNPPFMSGRRISTSHGLDYFSFLISIFEGAGNLCDLCGYFLRCGFAHLRLSGSIGLVTTKTICQGDTRESALAWICSHGGTIYEAKRRIVWPGEAAVIVSNTHICRGSVGQCSLDGRKVSSISAYLFTGNNHHSPARLTVNSEMFSLGVYPYGTGFLFEDEAQGATSVSEMQRILSVDNIYDQRIRPYVGGEEILDHPLHLHRRWVIWMNDIATEEELSRWPELESILRAKVKPVRESLGNNPNNIPLKRKWWVYQAPRPRMIAVAQKMTRILSHPNVSTHLAFVFLPVTTLVASPHNVFLLDTYHPFSVLQSRVHEAWARFFASTLGDGLRYAPSDCFETFPFPTDFETSPTLEETGRQYYVFRAALMVNNNEGLTKTYNRFHAPDHDGTGVEGRTPSEVVRDIETLRKLHAAMDRAALDAYGWTDIRPTCQFLLDYEEDEDEDDGGAVPLTPALSREGRGRRRKKPWRYRWPDDTRDEVLARLLALNAHRAEEERLQSLQQAADSPATYKKPRRARKFRSESPGLPLNVPRPGEGDV